MKIWNRPPKVCFATWEYPPKIGGVSHAAQRIVNFLTQAGADVHVIARDVEQDAFVGVPEPQKEKGAKIYRTSSFEQAITQLDLELSFDLFHGFFLPMAYPCIQAARSGKRPVIASIRGSDWAVWKNEIKTRLLVTAILRQASWVTSVNTDYLNEACQLVNLRERSCFIPNSIATENFPKWQFENCESGVIGTTGRFRSVKNIPVLLESFAKLDTRYRKRLLLVGAFGNETDKMISDERIRTLNIESEVHITGFVPNVQVLRYLRAMNLFVLCSQHEGCSNALLEAAAVGVPIVATAVGGTKDLFTDGESAVLVQPNNPLALKNAIASILKNPDFAQKLSEGALKTAEKFGLKREKNAWIELYNHLLDHFRTKCDASAM